MLLPLGAPVVYSVPDKHLTTTLKREGEVSGSIHHAELTDFAGLVTRVYEDGEVQLVIFPPNRPSVTVDRVAYGDGPGTCRIVGAAPIKRVRAPKPKPVETAPAAPPASSPQPSSPETAGEEDAGEVNPLIVDDEELGTS